ncbi:hypothetical protein BCR44DRAFT_1499651 [Catenaria anguillulae PL171]|uniref:PA14 domain-containing protein n=1 Tax=Catenaria anguillulae PL171 TaxID=765915 RepID=A0A1Y2HLH1_9FUNG|nr:hypothetical protein BCR44DRAFT_1499651 [Catenaria anguillulae PL171]
MTGTAMGATIAFPPFRPFPRLLPSRRSQPFSSSPALSHFPKHRKPSHHGVYSTPSSETCHNCTQTLRHHTQRLPPNRVGRHHIERRGATRLHPACTPNATGLTSQWIDYNNSSRPVKTYSGNVAIANQGHFFFDEYYTDIPGVNIGYNITLNFTLDDPNLATYRWEKPFFFPLDNKGFGMREGFLVTDPDLPANFRDGIPHNFWFTTQMEMTFFYRGGEVFRFNGDDDLWVFIDGKLTSCDLGGIHASRECQVNLDTLNLRVNSSYSMSVFHAERHTDASYFAVTTSVKPVNRPPVAANVTASVRAEKSIDLTLQGFDPDNDRLSIAACHSWRSPAAVVAGIVVGSVGAAALLGTAAAYFFYNRYMAAKFSAKWQEEWMKSNINENPLFVSNFKEQVNPLYNANT